MKLMRFYTCLLLPLVRLGLRGWKITEGEMV